MPAGFGVAAGAAGLPPRAWSTASTCGGDVERRGRPDDAVGHHQVEVLRLGVRTHLFDQRLLQRRQLLVAARIEIVLRLALFALQFAFAVADLLVPRGRAGRPSWSRHPWSACPHASSASAAGSAARAGRGRNSFAQRVLDRLRVRGLLQQLTVIYITNFQLRPRRRRRQHHCRSRTQNQRPDDALHDAPLVGKAQIKRERAPRDPKTHIQHNARPGSIHPSRTKGCGS